MDVTQPPRIVFMGTPGFAVPSLKALLDAGFDIAAVITAPDKPAGRGMKMTQSEIKKFAEAHGLKVLQPASLKSPDFLNELESIKPDLQVVVAFRMLPEAVWNLPPLGTINLHASLLPQYRGAAPINWAVINGETETGVTTFKLKHAIDTGNILLQKKVAIDEHDNAGTVHDKLMNAGSALLVKTVQGIREGVLHEIQQDSIENTTLKHAPKIFSEDCEIKWNDSTENIYNRIRGLSPYPSAFTFLKGKRIKISTSEKNYDPQTGAAGDFKTDRKSFLKFATNDGYINILKLKPEGKGEMTITDFLRGWRE